MASTVPEDVTRKLEIAARAAQATGAEDLVAFDVSQPLPFVDVFLLATGRSERNVVAIADAIDDAVREAAFSGARREGRAEGRWVLLDFGDVVVHVFHPEDRDFYGLERLWKDCPTISLESALGTAATSR